MNHVGWVATAALLVFTSLAHGAGDPDRNATTSTATYLLRSSLQVYPDGRQIRLLRALRQLHDPDLTPLFSELVQSRHPAMKIHGMLGLAEIDPSNRLDLVRVAAINEPAIQAQILSTALEYKLFDKKQAAEVVDWPGVEGSVKLMACGPLVEDGSLKRTDFLEEAIKSDNLARKSLAQVYMVQLGHEQVLKDLETLSQSTDSHRDDIQEILLLTVVRYNLKKLSGWAQQVAESPDVSMRLRLLAVKVGLRFGNPKAMAMWQKMYAASTDLAAKTRLALLALREARFAGPGLAEPLMKEEVPLLHRIGVACQALTTQQNIAESVVALVDLNPPHAVVNSWVLHYAEDEATDDDARAILLALVLAYKDERRENPAQLLDDATSAVQILSDRFPDDARKLLQPILSDDAASDNLVTGILLGLIRSTSAKAHDVILGLKPPEQNTARQLALLLKAKHNHPLTRNELDDLALLVRGGGVQDDSIRIQAAWTYLKLTHQTDTALAQALAQ
ncbi:MAG: hypothetical protein IT440_13770 [Phycisphaeraceae bacterium]|nr:hypothetical protein [Phycisphaeraceae bacterium]